MRVSILLVYISTRAPFSRILHSSEATCARVICTGLFDHDIRLLNVADNGLVAECGLMRLGMAECALV